MTDSALAKIFKAYDIRGKVGSELNAETAVAIGRAFADWLPAQGTVAVGRDMRPDSGELADALIQGLTSQGRDVLDIGQVTSDMSYFAVGKYNLAGAAMITASHNPGEYNGIKLYRDQVIPVGLNSGLDAIRDTVLSKASLAEVSRPGQISHEDITEDWIQHCLSITGTDFKSYNIAIDAGNGMAGKIIPELEPYVPFTIREMYFELDGTFPNHEANPHVVENLTDLIAEVKAKKLDFGIAFDGDGDRAGFVDDKGRPVSGSDLITIIARHYLTKKPNSEIVHEVRTSLATRELIQKWGGKPFRTKAGRVSIGKVMRERGAPFGGETTGHLFFEENYFADSGLLGALMVIVALQESGKKLSELVDEYHLYTTAPEINFEVADTAHAIEKISEAYSEYDQDRLDGLTVTLANGWFNVRPSNTEPLLRLNVEANTDKELRSIIDNLKTLIDES